jgi:hypothetical protein
MVDVSHQCGYRSLISIRDTLECGLIDVKSPDWIELVELAKSMDRWTELPCPDGKEKI